MPDIVRHIDEWHEDDGVVLWFPEDICDYPLGIYMGGPLDVDFDQDLKWWCPLPDLTPMMDARAFWVRRKRDNVWVFRGTEKECREWLDKTGIQQLVDGEGYTHHVCLESEYPECPMADPPSEAAGRPPSDG